MTDMNMNDTEINAEYTAQTWDELEVPTQLLRGIYAYGFEIMSPIQKKAIQPMITGRDIIAQAQSGTGKTATFTIGSLSKINLETKRPQVLVLSPTRELSKQTADVFNGIGCMMTGLQVQTLVGGSSVDEDMSLLKNTPPHIITGCPGRVYDILKKNQNIYKGIKIVILDEADEMLSFGFKEQVYNILQLLTKDIQICLFSATLPVYIHVIIDKIMKNPVKIQVKTEQLTLEGISQYYIAVEDDNQKYATLKDLYSLISVSQCIIYANSLQRVSDLYDAMETDGFPVCCIHSNMEKKDRDQAFTDFKIGKYRVLISSNVTARGIDIQQVSIVINFDLPKCTHTYLHRIGRSGRWGRKGVGINFITKRDVSKIREIEAHYTTQINELPANFDKLMG